MQLIRAKRGETVRVVLPDDRAMDVVFISRSRVNVEYLNESRERLNTFPIYARPVHDEREDMGG